MSSSAAALRFQIETALEHRMAGALTPRPKIQRDVQATGVPALDVLLQGGLPVGAISELVGPFCAGRTTLALAALAEVTREGKTVAWIDTTDALDPESAAAAGVALERQLWVRCGGARGSAAEAGDVGIGDGGPALLVEGSRTPVPSGGCGSPHPRSEVRGMPEALGAFLQPDRFSRPAPPRDPAVPRRNRMIGTPSAPNRLLEDAERGKFSKERLDRVPQDPRPFPRRAKDREEQLPTDRQPSRRQQMYAKQMEASGEPRSLQAAQIANTAAATASREVMGKPRGGHWTDNANNADGRCLATPPNAIAAGLPRFHEMEARASGQGHGEPRGPLEWKPPVEQLQGRVAEPGQSRVKGAFLAGEAPVSGSVVSPHWKALDQALRAADLLLASGGFGAIVLDLGGIPPEFAWRIPLATWFRFRAAADRSRTVLLLLTQHACARSSAELVLRLSPLEPRDAGTVMTGAMFRVEVDRRRFSGSVEPESEPAVVSRPVPGIHLVPSGQVSPRKPPQRATAWSRSAAWAAGQGASHAV